MKPVGQFRAHRWQYRVGLREKLPDTNRLEQRLRLPLQYARARQHGSGSALRTMFHTAKDALAGKAVQLWANKAIARYGRMQHVKIDSRRRTLELSCLLDGEPTPVTIRIENYVVETEQDKKFLRATTFHCTRPWLQSVLTDYGHRQRIQLPAWAAAVLSAS